MSENHEPIRFSMSIFKNSEVFREPKIKIYIRETAIGVFGGGFYMSYIDPILEWVFETYEYYS